MSDQIDLDAIRARVAAATPGPWHVWASQPEVQVQNADGQCLAAVETWGVGRGCIDADLIAHAPTDLAALCDEVERMRAENAALRADVMRYASGVASAERGIAALREIIAGRRAPPTAAENAAHDAAGGWWRYQTANDFGDVLCQDVGDISDAWAVTRWWSLGPDGAPCAWPVVMGVDRG